MTHLWPVCLALISAPLVHGQGSKNLPSSVKPADAAKVAAETARVLEMAKENSAKEASRSAVAETSVKKMEALAEKALESGSAKPSFAEKNRQAESQQRLKAAMSRVSPEGKTLLAQSGTAPSLRAPSEGPSAAKASPLSTDSPGPKPQPLKATPLVAAEKPLARTVIDAGSSFFDSKAGFGVFVDDVVLDHPEFHLTSDELEVYMNKEEPADAPKAAAPGKSPVVLKGPTAGELFADGAADAKSTGPAPSERKTGGNIKTAIAKGRKVLINKMSAKGEPQTGIGREAVYDGATGDMILRGWPQIQEGKNLTVATEPSTYFVIKANGNFQALGGRAQTRIIQQEEKKAPPPPASTSAASPVPPAPAPGNQPQGGQQ